MNVIQFLCAATHKTLNVDVWDTKGTYLYRQSKTTKKKWMASRFNQTIHSNEINGKTNIFHCVCGQCGISSN